jgi:pyruvate/2-oxoglutarate dehydrogenase complex dihydrolipoamide dehydrogenase (E3) component
MPIFDFTIIGAGAAGEAAACLALARGASVAIVERDLVGGGCPFFACMPSKTLLHGAAVQALGGRYPWAQASARRDWMINRGDADYPDDATHVHRLEKAGGIVVRDRARLDGPGRVWVALRDGAEQLLEARHVVVAVGSVSRRPPLEGLEAVEPWTNREATSTRELPRSLLVLGGGPTGVEMTQVFARYGVPVTIVESNERILARDHPRNSAAVTSGLGRDGVTVLTGRRALRARAGAGRDGAHVVDLDDGSSVEGHRVMLSVGRTFPLAEMGLESVGVDPASIVPDGRLRLGDGLWLIGDPAGPELHTHVSHYQGELAVRMALGDAVTPDYRAIPRCTYTDPEVGFVGMSLEGAITAGHDAVEFVADLGTSAKGYVSEADGHVTIVLDRAARVLLGAAIAGPGASEAIHAAVLAVKTRTPIDVLADTIHAFPTTARVLGLLYIDAARALAS